MRNKKKKKYTEIDVVDLFCGIGGLSYGMKLKGFQIKGGFDIDATCRYAYEYNNQAPFFYRDIKDVVGKNVKKLYANGALRILAGCAPCQPFSSYAFKNKEKDANKYDLLYEFGRLVREIKPDIVTMENVPSIKSFKLKNVLGDFVALLEQEGYSVSVNIVYCPQYGIPQTRRRLVLLASLLGPIKLIEPLIKDEKEYRTVRDTIGNLPPIAAGEVCKTDSFHRASRLSPKNLLRIQATSEGGSWKEWPDALKLECHKKNSGRSFGSVYGRMVWNMPSPTITTQCMGLGNGRFGHPSQNRAITPREAALLQTFPLSYKFFEDENAISIIKASRYVGNAVPPVLGEVIAESILHHLENR
jgi:DNA (cytosine-5)-methyltransferase 1